jgi:hypothetical protein
LCRTNIGLSSREVAIDRGPVSIVLSLSSLAAMSLLYATSYSNENAQQSALMRPSEIWFTQRKISQLFGNGWKRMTDTFGEIAKGKISVEDLPPINVFLYNNRYWVYSGNRRLRVLKELEKYNLIKHVQVYIVSPPVHNYDSFWVRLITFVLSTIRWRLFVMIKACGCGICLRN